MQENGYMESKGDWKGQDGVYVGEVATTTLLQTTPFWRIFERFLRFDSVRFLNSKMDRDGRDSRRSLISGFRRRWPWDHRKVMELGHRRRVEIRIE
jgi:hypothetical protein